MKSKPSEALPMSADSSNPHKFNLPLEVKEWPLEELQLLQDLLSHRALPLLQGLFEAEIREALQVGDTVLDRIPETPADDRKLSIYLGKRTLLRSYYNPEAHTGWFTQLAGLTNALIEKHTS